ncbi:MAG: DUF401 family protein [Bacillota bacterium]|jgi:integral membrane protein (TIGR00529 family)
MWSAVGVALAFLMIIVLVTRKVSLGYALLIGSVIVSLSSGNNPWEFLQMAGSSLVAPATLNLVSTLVLISMLGSLMKKLGLLDQMVDALQKVLRNAKLTIMVIPSIMGTLLVTGGAIMAAPMVNSLGDRLNLSSERRAAINLLFRHGWYFIFPFAPTFILIKEITGIALGRLIAVQFPMAVVAVVAGYFAYLRDVKDDQAEPGKPTSADYLQLLKYTAPISIPLVLALGFGLQFQLALLGGLTTALYFGQAKPAEIPNLLLKGVQIPILLSGIGIMIFKDALSQGDTMTALTSMMLNWGLPLQLIVVLLPLMIGLTSGSNTSAIGVSMPLLLPALQQSEHTVVLMAGVYCASFLGYFLSPLHLCQVLTLEFFKVKINDLYRTYVIPLGAMWATLIAILVVGTLL